MTAQENMLTPEEIKNTEKIQLKSLVGFMAGLGYEYEEGCWLMGTGGYFYSYEYSNKSRVRVSFQTACKLHNGFYMKPDSFDYEAPFDFDVLSLKKAKAARIVVWCHLQQNKKTGFIRASSQLVQFVEPEYEAFLHQKYI